MSLLHLHNTFKISVIFVCYYFSLKFHLWRAEEGKPVKTLLLCHTVDLILFTQMVKVFGDFWKYQSSSKLTVKCCEMAFLKPWLDFYLSEK